MNKFTSKLKTSNFNYMMLPIILIVTLVPIMLKIVIVPMDPAFKDFYIDSSSANIYVQSKAITLYILTAICTLLFIINFRKIKLANNKLLYTILSLTGVYWLFSLFSTMASEHSHIALFGVFNRAEGFFSITCYLIIFLYTLFFYRDTKDFIYILRALYFSILIIFIFGIFQYTGNSLINNEAFAKFLMPSNYNIESINIAASYYQINGTFSNNNYTGTWVGFTIPILLSAFFTLNKTFDKISNTLFLILSIGIMMGSNARSGILAVTILIIVILIFFIKYILKHIKVFLPIVIIFVISLIGFNNITHNRLYTKFINTINNLSSINISDNNYVDNLLVKDIKNTDTGVKLILDDNEININLLPNENGIVLTNKDGNYYKTTYTPDNNQLSFNDKSLEQIFFTLKSSGKYKNFSDILELNINNNVSDWNKYYLRIDVKTSSIYLSNYTLTSKIDTVFPPISKFWIGKEYFMSSRGFIWSRSIPMMSKTIFIGYGPDNYALYYPQNDLLGKSYGLYSPSIFVDKPHSIYIQSWLNEGGIASISLWILYVLFIISSFKRYAMKSNLTRTNLVVATCCFGLIGYLLTGIVNDSIVAIAPLTWIILGIGFNTLLSRN